MIAIVLDEIMTDAKYWTDKLIEFAQADKQKIILISDKVDPS